MHKGYIYCQKNQKLSLNIGKNFAYRCFYIKKYVLLYNGECEEVRKIEKRWICYESNDTR